VDKNESIDFSLKMWYGKYGSAVAKVLEKQLVRSQLVEE